MAEQLKLFYGPRVVERIADEIFRVYPSFPRARFVRESLAGLDALELTPRARHISRALRMCLPERYVEAIGILVASLGPPLAATEQNGMEPFTYCPHVFFVADYGLDDFEASMAAQHALTQRFSAEYSIRFFLDRYPEAYERLQEWATDPSVHVRRLVSEGSRPLLPWAPRLQMYRADPAPVLALLERLKDDPELYVRRSVANNLNDIGKDHPDLLVATCRTWLEGASAERAWLVRHALRSVVKKGHPGALALLGFGAAGGVRVIAAQVTPARVHPGQHVTFGADVVSERDEPQDLLIDYRVHYVKANGRTSPKVFKLRSLTLGPGDRTQVGGTVRFADLTTRRHYPGVHQIDLLVNGEIFPVGAVELSSD